VSQWERGEKHPRVPSLKLLALVAENRLQAVAGMAACPAFPTGFRWNFSPVPEGSKIETSMAKEYIERRDGNYYVAATRISLDSIVHAFRRGGSPETICQNFELLSLEEVYGAIAYYLANQADIDAYLARQGDKWAEGKRYAEPLPANLRERLTRAREGMHASRLS
jgi:uncharacterized protein (DUF433 family)